MATSHQLSAKPRDWNNDVMVNPYERGRNLGQEALSLLCRLDGGVRTQGYVTYSLPHLSLIATKVRVKVIVVRQSVDNPVSVYHEFINVLRNDLPSHPSLVTL